MTQRRVEEGRVGWQREKQAKWEESEGTDGAASVHKKKLRRGQEQKIREAAPCWSVFWLDSFPLAEGESQQASGVEQSGFCA